MKVLLVGDVHLAASPPSIRTETYCADILSKLHQVSRIAHERYVDAVVFAGDVFHVKAPTRTPHSLVYDVIYLMKNFERPVFVVPGNHDVRHDNMTTMSEQPLGVVFASGAATELTWEQTFRITAPIAAHGVDTEEVKLFGVPWLANWQTDLPVILQDWHDSRAQLLVTHAPIVKPGEDRPFEVIDATAWASLMGRVGDVYYGHMHDLDGAYLVAPDGFNEPFVFCNQGALSRGSIHESSLNRKPAVTLWDSDKDGVERFERIEVQHRPAADVFRLADKEVVDAKQQRLDVFLETLSDTKLATLSVEAVIAHLDTLDIDAATRQEVLECLEVAL